MKVSKMVPLVYYKESRDFSLMGTLYEFILNNLKTNSELVGTSLSNKNVSSDLLELAMINVGFIKHHHCSNETAIAIIKSFLTMMKKKGTEDALNDAIAMLLNINKIELSTNNVTSGYNTNKYHKIFYINSAIENVVVFEDLLNYILPAGVTYEIIDTSSYIYDSYSTNIPINEDAIKVIQMKDYSVGMISTENTVGDSTVLNPTLSDDIKERSTFYTGQVITETKPEENKKESE